MVFRLLRYLRIGLYWVISINPTRRKWFNCLIQRTCCHRNIPLLILSESMDAKFPTIFQSRSQTIHQRQCRRLKYILMPVCVFCFFHPISRSRNRPEVFFRVVCWYCQQIVRDIIRPFSGKYPYRSLFLEIFPWAYSFSHNIIRRAHYYTIQYSAWHSFSQGFFRNFSDSLCRQRVQMSS